MNPLYNRILQVNKHMNDMDFSENIQFEVIKRVLKKNSGLIRCEKCQHEMSSISECHFVHIVPPEKGGTHPVDNCQLLCSECNVKLMDERIQDFIIEQKAEELLKDEERSDNSQRSVGKVSKEEFDAVVGAFINTHGDIHKKDFVKVSNGLPSPHYVSLYYGNYKNLKDAFGISDASLNWNRETIKKALLEYVNIHGDLLQKELTKANRLPSIPCILSYYPEYSNFTEVKKYICNLSVKEKWTKEKAIEVGKEYVKHHGQITMKDLKGSKGLPTDRVISRLFGSINSYQLAIGASITQKNAYISKEEITVAVEEYFGNKDRVIDSMDAFFKDFPISKSVINKRYGYFEDFCKEFNIKVLKIKKAKYTRSEIDSSISLYMSKGNEIPTRKDLKDLGLPSAQAILRFYEDWKEPFIYYQKIFEKIGNNE